VMEKKNYGLLIPTLEFPNKADYTTCTACYGYGYGRATFVHRPPPNAEDESQIGATTHAKILCPLCRRP
jgi:hypothetical protein